MILKVQVSLASSDGVTRVLVYNKDRSFTYQGGVNQDMVDTMAGREKAFFEGGIVDGVLEMGDEVEDPGW